MLAEADIMQRKQQVRARDQDSEDTASARARARTQDGQEFRPTRESVAAHTLHMMGQVERSRIERAIKGTELYVPHLDGLRVEPDGIPLHSLSDLKTLRLSKDPKDTCSICLETFLVGNMVSSLHCGHFFHPSCIRVWLSRSKLCPLCKQQAAPSPMESSMLDSTPIFPYEPKVREVLNRPPPADLPESSRIRTCGREFVMYSIGQKSRSTTRQGHRINQAEQQKFTHNRSPRVDFDRSQVSMFARELCTRPVSFPSS
jgi:hypothetical protein